jgi:hypothetical protein
MPKVLTRLRIDEVSAVDRGAGDGVKIMLMKRDEEPYWKREFNQEERDRDAKSGAALPDGSFPIHNAGDLKNAMRAIGRSKNPGKAKAHIRARARALGLTDQLSDAFKRDTMSKFSEFFLGKKQDNSEVVEKAVAALAESLGTIMKGDDTVEKKGEDFAASLQEFQDHLVKNLTGAPALDSKEKDMLKSLAKALGLTVADNASDEDVQKQIAAHYAKQQRELDLAKAGFTAEELAHYKAFGENDDEDEDDKKKDEKKKFREMSHEERAKLMKKADDARRSRDASGRGRQDTREGREGDHRETARRHRRSDKSRRQSAQADEGRQGLGRGDDRAIEDRQCRAQEVRRVQRAWRDRRQRR